MNNDLSDKTVIFFILCTLVVVFLLVFTVLPSNKLNQPQIEWKESPIKTYNNINI